MSPRTSPRRKGRRPRARSIRSGLRKPVLALLLLALVFGGLYGLHLDAEIRTCFEGRRWALPGRVFARALELHAGASLSAREFERELLSLGYRTDRPLTKPGSYRRTGEVFEVHTRPFSFWDGKEPERRLRLAFSSERLRSVQALDSGDALPLVRLESPQIGSFYPGHREDRVLVRLDELPPLLAAALVEVEDRTFHRHHGVDLRGIARALLANLRAGRVVQGGSTLTQQLVKNYFLTSERTLWRKANEAAMAVLLELRYPKEEILEAYFNEIYFGQQADRAIHGVGLASQFYFGLPADDLDLSQIALLVGLVRGPSLYDPRQDPDRARARRDQILELLADRGLVSTAEAERARRAPLGVVPDPAPGGTPHPAFLDLVRRRLREQYRDQDLASEGLRIFTTLDPRVQRAAEEALSGRIRALERDRAAPPALLQGATVVAHPQTGEILGLVGGREVRYPGFNRALDAVRPIGSLVKPAVFLAALETPDRYTLAAVVEDRAVRVPLPDGSIWTPANYDRREHGPVTLYEALIRSHNLATVRLGLTVGVERVVDTLQRLGLDREIEPYPALLLGALELSPLEVAQIYQTLAGSGTRTPLRAIRAVLDATNRPLQRYPLRVEEGVESGPLFLLNTGLAGVVAEGTGSQLAQIMPEGRIAAGKTGTTDDLRDSWFAGYTADWLCVVWLGMDDNRPCGLSGAEGALQVWGDLFARLGGRSVDLSPPGPVEYGWVNRTTGVRVGRGNEEAVRLPFLAGSAPSGGEQTWLQRFSAWLRGGPR